MKLTIKTLTIEEVEDAILQGQEQHQAIMADVLAAYFQPLIDFQLAMMTQQGAGNNELLRGMGAPSARGFPGAAPQNQSPGYRDARPQRTTPPGSVLA